VVKEGRLCKAPPNVAEMPNGVPPEFDNKKSMLYAVEAPSWPMLYQGKGKPAKLALGGILGGGLLAPKPKAEGGATGRA
jgi:hypothetical protein